MRWWWPSMPDHRDEPAWDEAQRKDALRAQLARVMVEGEADEANAALLLKGVGMADPEFMQAVMNMFQRGRAGPKMTKALRMLDEAGLIPFRISTEVKRLAAGRPKGAKGKPKKEAVDLQVEAVLTSLADPRNARRMEIRDAVATVEPPGPKREALRKRVYRRLASNSPI